MALAGCGCVVRSAGAQDTACAIYRQHRQNNVCIDYGDDKPNAKLQGRRQIYGRIRFIEPGFGKINSGDNRYAD